MVRRLRDLNAERYLVIPRDVIPPVGGSQRIFSAEPKSLRIVYTVLQNYYRESSLTKVTLDVEESDNLVKPKCIVAMQHSRALPPATVRNPTSTTSRRKCTLSATTSWHRVGKWRPWLLVSHDDVLYLPPLNALTH
jgi:hypothetical protein